MAGRPVHLEIPAPDTGKASAFYGSLFGWQFQEFEGSPSEYLMTRFKRDVRRRDLQAGWPDAWDARLLRRRRHPSGRGSRARARRRRRRRDAGSRDGVVRLLHRSGGQRLRSLAERPRRHDVAAYGLTGRPRAPRNRSTSAVSGSRGRRRGSRTSCRTARAPRRVPGRAPCRPRRTGARVAEGRRRRGLRR